MSAPENGEHVESQKGSVKITRNAKGEAQFEVKSYIGDTAEELGAAQARALEIYRNLETEFGFAGVRR